MTLDTSLESSTRGRAGGRSDGSLGRALWLAGEDVRRTWISYPATGIAFIFFGFIAIGPVGGVFEVGRAETAFEEGLNGSMVDLYFLSVCSALGINFLLNRDYGARYRHDNMSRRLSFLRGLPISTGEIVAGRALSMLLAFVVAVPCFFMPLFLVSPEAGGRLSTAEFLGFAAMWVGYALFAAGFYLYAWLGFGGRGDLKGTLGLVVFLALIAILANFALDIHLVSGSINLAREHGPLTAVLALVTGAAGFIFWGLVTRNRLRRRDLSV